MKTITLTNFAGKLTKEHHGDINSGLCPLKVNFGGVYPFSNYTEQELSFMEAPTSVTPGTLTAPLIYMVNAVNPSTGVDPATFAVDLRGSVYMVNVSDTVTPTADNDTLVSFTNKISSATLFYGGGLKIFQNALYIGHDNTISYSDTLIPGSAVFANVGGGSVSASRPRPLELFLGNLYSANGNNLVEILGSNPTAINTVTKLSPSLPNDYVIRDLKVSPDGRYLIALANTNINNLNTLILNGASGSTGNRKVFGNIDSAIVTWNGTDAGYTDIRYYKGIYISSIVVSNVEMLLFGKDDSSIGLWDLSGNKVSELAEVFITTVGNPPEPGSSFALGRKIFFLAQYKVGQLGNSTTLNVFCLDRDTESLYCLYNIIATAETIKGALCVPTNHNTNASSIDMTRSKVYFSYANIPVTATVNNQLLSQHLQNYNGAPFLGTYCTQIQKFPKKVTPRELRVYTQNTSSGVSFSVALVDDAGNGITNASKTYTFTAGTDKTKGQGALDLIKFKFEIVSVQSFGIKITNLGTTNPVIEKVEVDYDDVNEPKTSG